MVVAVAGSRLRLDSHRQATCICGELLGDLSLRRRQQQQASTRPDELAEVSGRARGLFASIVRGRGERQVTRPWTGIGGLGAEIEWAGRKGRMVRVLMLLVLVVVSSWVLWSVAWL